MDFMFDWDGEGDRFSFEDSDRFEEDSLCSWISEPESLCNNWRGWRKQTGPLSHSSKKEDGQVTSLIEIAAQAVAGHIPFEVVEHFYPPIPEQLQLRIAFWSFPENEEDIRLYSCLANGSADEFQKGEHLFKAKAVKEPLQIGFHLSATVIPPQTVAQTKGHFSVAIVFDRRRISSCNCTCKSTASWCAHVVALCLFRIHQAHNVCLRAPVSESLSRLQRDQLQKFAQYLISELPQQILPTAQRLLDELLSSQQTAINTVCGAPDPTAGPSASEQTTWCLDETTLHENIKKTLIKFCVPSPTVFSDVTYLSSTAPPAASEWQSLLRPMRGREPEGMWNLLSIVREMYKRHDSNAIPLLEILTEEVLACEQILMWWFNTKISASHNAAGGHSSRGNHNSSSSSQHAASSLCDEIVTLWRLAALNPSLSPIQRDDLSTQLKDWHISCIEKVRKGRGNTVAGGNSTIKKNDIEIFPGFKAAIEACQLDWIDYYIPWITYVEKSPLHWRFSFGKAQEADGRGKSGRAKNHTTSQVSGCAMKTGPDGRINLIKSQEKYKLSDFATVHTDCSSSEGFCDTDRRESIKGQNDSDSDLGGDIGDNMSSGKSRKFEPSSGSSNNSTLVNISHFKVRKLNQGESVNDDEGLPSESGYHGSNISGHSNSTLNSPSATAAALNLPAHVKIMKSDDMDIESHPLVAALAANAGANQSTSKGGRSIGNKNSKQGSSGSNGSSSGSSSGSTPQNQEVGAVGGAAAEGTAAGAAAKNDAQQPPQQQQQAQQPNDEYQLYFYDPRAAGSINQDKNTDTKKKKVPTATLR